MFFDEEIGIWWCLGDTWRCTRAEALGLWSVVSFYTAVLVVTITHGIVQHSSGTAERNDAATRRHTSTAVTDDWVAMCSLFGEEVPPTFCVACLASLLQVTSKTS